MTLLELLTFLLCLAAGLVTGGIIGQSQPWYLALGGGISATALAFFLVTRRSGD